MQRRHAVRHAVALATATLLAGALTTSAIGAPTTLDGAPSAAVSGAVQAVDAVTSTDIWAVGYQPQDGGTVTPLAEHFNGRHWRATTTRVPDGRPNGILQGVSAAAGDDVWAVGYSSVVPGADSRTLAEHWNGRRWRVLPTAEPAGATWSALQSVTVVAPDDVWAVGYYYDSGDGGSIIEHWDGKHWTLADRADPAGAFHANLTGIDASSARQVWATGFFFDSTGAGVTLTERWNGRRWKTIASPNPAGSPDAEIHAVSVHSKRDVWATGFYTVTGSTYLALVEHWDGHHWSVVDSPNPDGSTNSYLYGAAAIARGDAWATGYYFASGAYHTFAEHWDGSAWQVVETPDLGGGSSYLFGMDAIDRNDLWAAGFAFTDHDVAFVEHYDGTAWSLTPLE